ncbi:MAG: hypothetical protein WC253_06915 [Sulfurovaceae bacterium]|jgi:hypothetical protein|nr:hypothetical protein [Sulfurovaceae bacterium]
MKKLLLLTVVQLMLIGCNLKYIDAPIPRTYEVWTKEGFTREMTEREAKLCGNFNKKISYKEYYDCMIKKGFKYNVVRGQ